MVLLVTCCRLLHREAVERSQAPHQVAAEYAHDLPTGEDLSQEVQGLPVLRGVEERHKD